MRLIAFFSMLSRLAPSVGVAICATAWIGACRDWDRYEPVEIGGGGAGVTTTSTSTGMGAGSSAGGGGTGGSGVGGGTGGGQPLDCGKIDILNDDFEDPSWSWRWASAGLESNYLRQGGELVLSMPAGEYGNQLESTAGFDFRGRTFVLELAPPIPADVVFWFNVARDPDNYLEIGFDGAGQIYYGYEKDGAYFTVASDDLPPGDYRFWRFREENEIVFFEISTDGASWMERQTFNLSDLFDPAFTSIYVGAWKGDTGTPAEVHLARVYSGETSSAQVCPISALTDDFDDGERGPQWTRSWSDAPCPFDESSGTLQASCSAMAYAGSSYGSSSVYDLTGSSITVEVVESPLADSSAWMGLRLERPEVSSGWSFEIVNGQLELYEFLDGNWNIVEFGPYDADLGRFLRVREDAGQVYFERSPDGASFTEFDQRTAPFDVTELRVSLQGGAGDNAAPVTIAFDNLNGGS